MDKRPVMTAQQKQQLIKSLRDLRDEIEAAPPASEYPRLLAKAMVVLDSALSEPEQAAAELVCLRKIQAAALRVASSRRNGIVTDQGVLDLLDAVLEGRE